MRREQNNKIWQPAQPPVPVGRFLIDWLWEIGPTQAGGMASAPISWAEIGRWQEITGIELLPWQARLMRRLSVDFVAEAHAATKADAAEPWDRDERIRATKAQEEELKRD